MSISSTTTLEQVVAADIITVNTGSKCILKICVPVVNKDIGDGDALKENNQYHRSKTATNYLFFTTTQMRKS